MSSGHSLSTDRSGTETGAMPSLGGTALAVGCLSESMEGALRERSNIFQACAGKCCSSKRSLHWEHGVLGRVALNIIIYNFYESKNCLPSSVTRRSDLGYSKMAVLSALSARYAANLLAYHFAIPKL